MRCEFYKKDGERCRNHTLKGFYCWLHAKQQYHLHVKKSETHGFGLYAEKEKKMEPDLVFKKGQTVANYTGDKIDMSEKELDKLIDNGLDDRYILNVGKDKFINGENPNSSYARFANDAKRTKFKNNSKLSVNIKTHTASLKATQPIKNGSEIFVGYGKKYWFGR